MEIGILGFILLYIVISAIGLGLDDMLKTMGDPNELPDNPVGKILSCLPFVNFAWIPSQFIMVVYYYVTRNQAKN